MFIVGGTLLFREVIYSGSMYRNAKNQSPRRSSPRRRGQGAVGAEVEGVVGVALLAPGPGGEPPGAVPPPDVHHVPYAPGQVGPLLDDGAPGAPHRGLRRLAQGPGEGGHVLPVERLVHLPLHVLGPGGPLGVDVEHDEAVVAVAPRHPLHALECGVQGPWGGGGGVHPHADQGPFARVARMYRYFPVGVGHVEPTGGVVVRGRRLGRRQGGRAISEFGGQAAGDVHGEVPPLGEFMLIPV